MDSAQFYGLIAAGVDPATGQQLYLTKDKNAVPYSGHNAIGPTFIGSAQPDFVYGMTNSVTYKNFDLRCFFRDRREIKYLMESVLKRKE